MRRPRATAPPPGTDFAGRGAAPTLDNAEDRWMPSRSRGGRRLRAGSTDPGRTSRAGELSSTAPALDGPGRTAPCASRPGRFRAFGFYVTEKEVLGTGEEAHAERREGSRRRRAHRAVQGLVRRRADRVPGPDRGPAGRAA